MDGSYALFGVREEKKEKMATMPTHCVNISSSISSSLFGWPCRGSKGQLRPPPALRARINVPRSSKAPKRTTLRLAASSSSSSSSSSFSCDLVPLVGNIAPDFEAEAVLKQEFVKVKLSSFRGTKYVVLLFYPMDFSFVCPTVNKTSATVSAISFGHCTEISAFSDRYKEFEMLNTEVIAVSSDSVFSHLAFVQTDRKSGGVGDICFPLVADLNKSVSTAYKILIPTQGVPLRGLYIIDKEGVIQHSTINNFAIGRSVDEVLRILQAIQYVQENSDEVCPANWKPGERSMKSDPKLSKEYFQNI